MQSVLVVDDDPGTVATYRFVLRSAGYQVETADGGLRALQQLTVGTFSTALVDLRMPDMSGLELLAEARARGCKTPIVIMTAWDTGGAEVAGRQLGAVDFLHKPFDDLDAVVAMVRKHSSNVIGQNQASLAPPNSAPGYAARRWASVVFVIVQGDSDVSTIAAWSERAGVGSGTLKTWCRAAGVRPTDSLAFARLLRVVILHTGSRCDWHNVLAIVDPRTIDRLLERASIKKNAILPDISIFVRNQRLVTSPPLLLAIHDVLGRSD